MEKFKWMEKCLIENVEKQMTHLETVDAAELGEVIDMIKDLEQAMYYCSVVKAMEGKSDSSYSYATKSSTHDAREGWSHKKRKEYLESKEMHHDKAVQMQKLEEYLSELNKDIMDMAEDCAMEEKQMLQQKLSTLAAKVTK